MLEKMGKKGSKFSLIKRFFACNPKKKPTNGSYKKNRKEKKDKGILRSGKTKWFFIPLFREPSSIEKILGEANQVFFRPNSPRVASPDATSVSEVDQSSKEINYVQRPGSVSKKEHVSATVIQAAYRGHMTRRNFKSLRGLVRLKGAVRGQNVNRQTMRTVKQMHLFVRVQSQIRSRRIQRLENQNHTKSLQLSEAQARNNEDWDASSLTKDEIEARRWKKLDATIKRERAIFYANSHQMWKSNSKPALSPSERSNVSRWWWKWLEHKLPLANASQSQTAIRKHVNQSIGSFKRKSKKILVEHSSTRSTGDTSLDSAASIHAIVGRKPFNRFV